MAENVEVPIEQDLTDIRVLRETILLLSDKLSELEDRVKTLEENN